MAERPDLQGFVGNWRLSRVIDDAKTGQQMRFEGTAQFVSAEGGLIYDEEGTLTAPGQAPMQGTRRYLWREVGADIAVLFADGRPFHLIGVGGAPEASHDCPPDWYEVCYDFSQWPDWTARWRVTGPRKDYVSITRYRRV